jgi:hypothetical protein
MQTSTAPPRPVRANGHPATDGRKRLKLLSPPELLIGLHSAQTQRKHHPNVHETTLQLIGLLAQALGRLERQLTGRVTETTSSVVHHAIELLRQLENPNSQLK